MKTLLCFALLSLPVAAESLAPDDAFVAQSAMTALAKKRTKRRTSKRRTKKRRNKRRGPVKVTVPVDIGVGFVGLMPNAPSFNDFPAHLAITVQSAVIVDGKTIRRFKNRIPRQYRGLVKNGLRMRPPYAEFIPEVIAISPMRSLGFGGSDLYAGIWRPIGIGISPVRKPIRLSARIALSVVAGVYLDEKITPLIRPGITLQASAEVPLGESFLVELGWMSDFFVPQPVGGLPWEFLPLEDSLWHLGGPFVAFHFRFPYTASL